MLREFELHYAGLELQAQMVSRAEMIRSRRVANPFFAISQAKIIAGRPIVKDQADVGSQLPIGLSFRSGAE